MCTTITWESSYRGTWKPSEETPGSIYSMATELFPSKNNIWLSFFSDSLFG